MARTLRVLVFGLVVVLASGGANRRSLCTTSHQAGTRSTYTAAHHAEHHLDHVDNRQVLYLAGQDLINEATIRKAVRKELNARDAAAPRETAKQLASLCASCHGGTSPKGGLDLSGKQIEAPDYVNFDLMHRGMADVPLAMLPVMEKLQADSELADLVRTELLSLVK